MTIFSKLSSVTHECNLYMHPWNHSCIDSNCGMFASALKYGLKFYGTLYLGSLVLKGRIPTKKTLKQTTQGIVQSALFLSLNLLFSLGGMCIYRRLFGKTNYYTIVMLPTFIGNLLAILMERPERRRVLALYMLNLASESLYKMGLKRDLIKAIPNGTAYLFMLATAAIMYFYRSIESKDTVITIMRYIVGPYEANGYEQNCIKQTKERVKNSTLNKTAATARFETLSQITKFLLRVLKPVTDTLKHQPRHLSCPHPYGCIHYITHGSTRIFAVGVALKAAFTFVLQSKKWIKHPSVLPSLLVNKSMFNLGMFAGSFTGIFRLVSCLLRWTHNKDSKYHGIIAGLLAGTSFYPFANSNIALYAIWKAVEITYDAGTEQGILPTIPGATSLIYSSCMALMFHLLFFERQSLKSSYLKFLTEAAEGRAMDMSNAFHDTFGSGGALVTTSPL